MFNTPIHTNAQSVDRVLGAGLPVVLAFWRRDSAAWSAVQPMLDRLAKTYTGQVLIAKIDAANEPDLVRRYNVSHVPTLIVVRDGKQVAESNGVASEGALDTWLKALLQGETLGAPHGATTALGGQTPQVRTPGPEPSVAPSGGSGPMVLTETSFDSVVARGDQPVLVDFWAPWCGPCRQVGPVVDRLAGEFAGRAVVGKLNVDDHPRIAQRYGIQGIPALFVFKGGKVVERIVGAQPAAVIRQALARHMS